MTPIQRIPASATLLAAACLLLLPSALRGQEGAAAYLRTVEGYADHLLAGGDAFQAAANYPVVPGDRLALAPGARLEVVLPDGSAVRAADETDLRFTALAGALESPADATRLELERGELQIVRPAWSGPEPVQVLLGGAWIALEAPGSYRVGTDGYGTSRVTVREGWAEVSTPRGGREVGAAETAWVREGSWSIELTRAEARDELEWWGASLDREARLAAERSYVDPQLAYAAAPLEGRGEWVQVSGRPAWRPWVEVGWRPYVEGYWAWTPAGMAWVASEPWGWLTHHYGLWEQVSGFGWVWVPGRVYSPAWVYWYWGPSYVAWAPAGLYASVYASWDYLPSRGIYGWVSGGWDHYHDWVFCRVDDFGYGRHHGRFELGREVARHAGGQLLPRGVLATDTRPLTHGGRTGAADLRGRLVQARQRVEGERSEDLTAFVARRPEAAARVTRMFVKRPEPAAAGRGLPAGRGVIGRAAVGTGRPGGSPSSTVGRGAVRPAQPAAPSADRWRTRVIPSPGSTDSSRWTVRPGQAATPSAEPSRIRRYEPPEPVGTRPPASSYRPPEAEAWRERIRLLPPSPSSDDDPRRPALGAGEGTGWPRGLDRGGSPVSGADRPPLVRRVLEEIQRDRNSGGWSTLRPPTAAPPQGRDYRPPERPQSVRPPERPQPDRSQRGRSETRSRGDDPPSRGRSGAASSRSPKSRGDDPPG